MIEGNTSIPLVIGITGHRNISETTEEQIYDTSYAMLMDLKNRYPNTPIRVLSSLAAGADTACAEAAIAAGTELVVPLPMPADEYRKDFPGISLARFDSLLARATDVFVVPEYEKSEDPESRGFYYRQAGIYVTDHSHILFACWDGKENPTPDGAGTFETVKLMRETPFFKTKDSVLDKNGGLVLQFVTPCENETAPVDIYSLYLLDGSNPVLLMKPQLDLKEFSLTDEFNRDLVKYGSKIEYAMAESLDLCIDPDRQSKLSSDESTMLWIYAAADSLALFFQKKRLLALKLLAVMGLLFVLFFLFYDELSAPLMLVGYGGLIVIAVACNLVFSRKRYHDKYVLYRVLSEALRIQLFMDTANIFDFSIHVPWWKRTEGLSFVNDTCRVLRKNVRAEFNNDSIDHLEENWIDPQIIYHLGAIARKGGKNKENKKIARSLLFIAILFFVIVTVIEAAFPYIMEIEMPNFFWIIFPFVKGALTWNSLFKIILGAVSAAAAFVANYYGKLALPEQKRGSERMYKLYSQVKRNLISAKEEGDLPAAKQSFISLADAAFEENLDWYAYYADNRPEFLIG